MRHTAAASILLTLIIGACSEPPAAPQFEIAIAVEDETGQGLPGARVAIDARPIGTTGPRGTLKHTMTTPGEQTILLQVSCPDGTETSGPMERAIRPHSLRAPGEASGPLQPLRVQFRCERRIHSHVVVVRTNLKESCPIELLGETVGHTGAAGIHQLVVDGLEGEAIEVRIDTSANLRLRPASPARTFRIPAASRLLVFDQDFEIKGERVPQKRRRRRGPRRL